MLQNWMLRPSPPELGAQQHRDALAEVGDGGVLVGAGQAAMELRERNAGLRQQRRKPRQRLARLDEDELLLGLVAAEKLDQRGLLGAGAEHGPARGEVAPGGIVRPPSGETFKRGCRCGGRGPGGGEQVLQHEGVASGRAGGCKPTDGCGECAIGRALRGSALDPDRRGVTARQLERDHRAGVADHRPPHQFAQPLGIGRLARLAGRHIGGAELGQRLEDAGLEQRQEIVQLDEVILHRSRRQEEQEALVQGVDKLPTAARPVAQVVRLIDDDEIEVARAQMVGMFLPARRRNRGDDPRLLPEGRRVLAKQRIMGGAEGKSELGRQLLAPLPDQRGRRQHQNLLGHAAQRVFL